MDAFYDLWGYRTQIAEWASIFAFVASSYAAIQIAKVRARILGRVRLPEITKSIQRNKGELFKLLDDKYESRIFEFTALLAILETDLKAVRRSTTGPVRRTAREVLNEIARFKGRSYIRNRLPQNSRDDAWRVYGQIEPIVMELGRTIEDQRRGA